MADLLIRNIRPDLKRQLEMRARRHKHSLSTEASNLIERGLGADRAGGLGTRLFSLIDDKYRGDDLVFERDDEIRPPPDFK